MLKSKTLTVVDAAIRAEDRPQVGATNRYINFTHIVPTLQAQPVAIPQQNMRRE